MFVKKENEIDGVNQGQLIFKSLEDKAIFEDEILKWLKESLFFPWCNKIDGIDEKVVTFEFISTLISSLFGKITGCSDECAYHFDTFLAGFPDFEVKGTVVKDKQAVDTFHFKFQYDRITHLFIAISPGATFQYGIYALYPDKTPASSCLVPYHKSYERMDKKGNRKITCSSFSGCDYSISFSYADELLCIQVNYPNQVDIKIISENPYVDTELFEKNLLESDGAVSGKITEVYKMLRLALKVDCEEYPKILVQRYKKRKNKSNELLESIELQHGKYYDIRLMDERKTISIYSQGVWSHQTANVTWAKNLQGVSRTEQAKTVPEMNSQVSLEEEFGAAVNDVLDVFKMLKTIENDTKKD